MVSADDYHAAAQILRDATGCQFEQMIDLCGVDYSEYKGGTYEGPRFCVVLQLLSVSLNQRFAPQGFCDRRCHARVDVRDQCVGCC